MVAKAEIRLPSGLILSYEGDPGRSWTSKPEPAAELTARLLDCLEATDWEAIKSAARVLHGPPRPRPVPAPAEPKAAAATRRNPVQQRPDPQAVIAQPGLDLAPA